MAEVTGERARFRPRRTATPAAQTRGGKKNLLVFHEKGGRMKSVACDGHEYLDYGTDIR